jgi:hypothetical protein
MAASRSWVVANLALVIVPTVPRRRRGLGTDHAMPVRGFCARMVPVIRSVRRLCSPAAALPFRLDRESWPRRSPGFRTRGGFNFAGSGHRVGAAPDPFDRLGHIFNFPQPEAGHQLVGSRERTIDHRPVCAAEGNTFPADEGLRPSPDSSTPASTSSSFYLRIASRSSVEGMVPFSLSCVALTRTTTRTGLLLALLRPTRYGSGFQGF